VIVADDLTGACDAAGPFAARGARCIVLLRSGAPAGWDITAFSTESRDLDDGEMRRRMEAVASGASGATVAGQCGLGFEETLSTESRDLDDALMRRRMEAVASVASVASVAGQCDLVFKKIDSTLRGNVGAEILACMAAFGRRFAVVTPAFPDMGRTVLGGYLHVDGVKCTTQAGMKLLDAVENADLDRIVADNWQLPGPVLWAGSAGLASALARRLYGPPRPPIPPAIDGRLVFCIGSDHPATLAQVRELSREAAILPILRGRTTADEIRHGLRGAGALFVTGGDTASLVLAAIGAESIAIRHEIVTGVPWGVLSGGNFDGCPVVTKSGGFGAPDALLRVAEFFRCHKP